MARASSGGELLLMFGIGAAFGVAVSHAMAPKPPPPPARRPLISFPALEARPVDPAVPTIPRKKNLPPWRWGRVLRPGEEG